jgi:type VI secretion system FHA domain protein
MEIDLHLVNRQAQPPEWDVHRNLAEGGVTIGRSPTNELCLDDPERVISGQHARIDVRDGGVWITDTSRNGTYLNHAVEPLPSHQSMALYDGDRLTIGPFEIILTFGSSAAPPARLDADPFARLDSEDLPGLDQVGATTDILDLLAPDGRSGDNPAGSAPKEPRRPVERHLTDNLFADASPLDDDLAGPAPEASAPEAPHRQTPVEHVFYRPADRLPVPDDYDLLNDAWVSPGDAAEPARPEAAPASPEPPRPAVLDGPERPSSAPEDTPLDAAPPRRPAPPRPKPLLHQQAPATGELDAFLAGLGVGKPADVEDPEKLFRQAGELLRVLATGLTQTMIARAQFKSELRLGVTTIRAAENNPFKFSVDTTDLLERLLLRPSPGYLPALTAAREAFDDIQAHEMAMTAGLQAALRALFARFEPNQLERRLSRRSGLDQVLPMARKARYWDLFTETYEQVAADAAEDFMQLFDDAFARAYREQIRHLAELRGSRQV